MEQFHDTHYFQLPSQGNIYTVTHLQLANGTNKLLVATLKREIFCLEHQDVNASDELLPSIKEIPFTYIPNGAEIISIDAFNKSQNKNEFVIGITIIKNNNELNSLETFLNIYSEWEESDDFNIENIAQNCLNVELNFTPYKLLHTYLVTWNIEETISKQHVFVLSGSDHQIHVYREYTSDHVYKEIDNKEHFAEFVKFPSPVTWIDIFYTEDYNERICAFACECGYFKLTKTSTKTNKVLFNFSARFNNFITKISIVQENVPICNKFPSKLLDVVPYEKARPILNLVVLNSILPGVIFQDVLKYGLSNYYTLPRHDCSTSVQTCCEVADIDFDGQKEILIGNSAEEILFLKHQQTSEKTWCLEELKKVAAPIFYLKYIDLSGDGVKELVVISMRGIHVLQHDLEYVQKVLEAKIDGVKR